MFESYNFFQSVPKFFDNPISDKTSILINICRFHIYFKHFFKRNFRKCRSKILPYIKCKDVLYHVHRQIWKILFSQYLCAIASKKWKIWWSRHNYINIYLFFPRESVFHLDLSGEKLFFQKMCIIFRNGNINSLKELRKSISDKKKSIFFFCLNVQIRW